MQLLKDFSRLISDILPVLNLIIIPLVTVLWSKLKQRKVDEETDRTNIYRNKQNIETINQKIAFLDEYGDIIRSMLKHSLKERATKYINQNYVLDEELNVWYMEFDIYKNRLGGNGIISQLQEQLKKVPVLSSEAILKRNKMNREKKFIEILDDLAQNPEFRAKLKEILESLE